MNDLAERALHGLDLARRAVLARPLPGLAAVGFVAAADTVWFGGRTGPGRAAVPLNSWLGLLPPAGYEVDNLLPGLAMLAGIAVLALVWLAVLRLAFRRRVGVPAVWAAAGACALPFVVGPPLLSTDVYAAAAHGLLARQGMSPYHHGPIALTDQDHLVNAIDPTLRATHATDGPVAVAIEHVLTTVSAGNALAVVLLLRALAVVSTVAIGRLAMDLAARRRAAALAITVLNPAVLLYVVSGAHLEGLLVALLLAAFVRAGQRRWAVAIALAALAAGVRPVALVAVVALIVAHAVGAPRRLTWRVAARDTVLGALVLTAAAFVVPYGLGWANNVGSLTDEHTPYAPVSLVSDLIGLVVSSASFDDLAVGGRVAGLLATLTVIAYLLWTVGTRPLERTVGYALLTIGLLGPVLFPWYLLWGLLCLAPTAQRTLRDWTIALSVAACVLVPDGLAARTGEVATGIGLGLVAAGLAPRLLRSYRRRTAAQPDAVSASPR